MRARSLLVISERTGKPYSTDQESPAIRQALRSEIVVFARTASIASHRTGGFSAFPDVEV